MSELRRKVAGLWKRNARTDITPTEPTGVGNLGTGPLGTTPLGGS